RTAAASSGPCAACRAPSNARASARACGGRSSALLGMHAQYEHSPPTSSDSTTTVDRPPRTVRAATFSPVGPAPITITSYARAGMRGFLLAGTLLRAPRSVKGGRPTPRGVELAHDEQGRTALADRCGRAHPAARH